MRMRGVVAVWSRTRGGGGGARGGGGGGGGAAGWGGGRRGAPREARRSWSSPAVSEGPRGVEAEARMSPASMTGVTSMTQTPARGSLLRTAQLMGAAPRYLGRREEWRLMGV